MTAAIISIGALGTAAMLRKDAPPSWIGPFLAEMTRASRDQRDAGREAFWREVAWLLEGAPLAI